MTKNEIGLLLAKVVANYPSLQNKDTKIMAELWYAILKDVPFDVAEKAILNIIATDEFPPTLARVRKEILRLTEPEEPEWIEAWGEVMKAVYEYGTWEEERALESLSPLTRIVAEAIGWKSICLGDAEVVRGQFRMAYEALKRREEEEKALIYHRPATPKLEQSKPKKLQEPEPHKLPDDELAEKWEKIGEIVKDLAENKSIKGVKK